MIRCAFLSLFLVYPALANEIVQEYNGQGGLPAERGTSVPLATTADDFLVPSKSTIVEITSVFLSEDQFPMEDWEFVIFEDDNGIPGREVLTISGGVSEDTGDDDFGLSIHVVIFDSLDVSLRANTTYWLAVRGVGNGNGRAFWGESDLTNGSEAMYMSEFFGVDEWTPWSEFTGAPSDTAWTMTFIPAPGAGALVLACMSVTRPRRRRQDQI